MRINKIEIGETYRHKGDIGRPYYFKAIKILRPKEGENTNTFSVIKGEYTTSRNSTTGLIKYFRASSLEKL